VCSVIMVSSWVFFNVLNLLVYLLQGRGDIVHTASAAVPLGSCCCRCAQEGLCQATAALLDGSSSCGCLWSEGTWQWATTARVHRARVADGHHHYA
jgi:hypothetical protein